MLSSVKSLVESIFAETSLQISKVAKCVCSEIMIVSIFNAKHPKQREEYSEEASTNLKNKLVEQI